MSTNSGPVSNNSSHSSPTPAAQTSGHYAWKIHWILFSIIFFVIGCYAVVLLTKSIRRAPDLTRNYRLSVFSLIIVLCFSRTLYLVLDPYEVGEALLADIPLIPLRLIYSLGQPSLTAGFGLVHASFLNIAKVRQYHHESLLKTRTILLVVGVYFAFGMVSQVIAVVYPSLDDMLAVSCGFAVVGCTVVTGTIIYSGVRILRTASENKKFITKRSLSNTASTEQLVRAKSVTKVAKVTLAAATFCAGITIANSVAFVRMFSEMASANEWETPWKFLTYVSCVRVLEVAMAVTLIYALSCSKAQSTNNSFLRRLTRRLKSSSSQPPTSPTSDGEGPWKISSFSSEKELVPT